MRTISGYDGVIDDAIRRAREACSNDPAHGPIGNFADCIVDNIAIERDRGEYVIEIDITYDGRHRAMYGVRPNAVELWMD